MVINELMYNPWTDPLDPTDRLDEIEFVELYNPSPAEAVDVSGRQIVGGGLTLPPGSVIQPDGYLVAARNDAAFRQKYGPGHYVAAQYPGKLDGGGEAVILLDRAVAVVDAVTYDDNAPWPKEPDGGGPSIELIDPSTDKSQPVAWAARKMPGGTPGAVNSVR